MSRGRTLNPDSLHGRVEAFFQRCPNEWLTWEDAATKFGCTVGQLKSCTQRMRERGRLALEVVSVLRIKDERQ